LKDISRAANEGEQVRSNIYDVVEDVRRTAYSEVREQFLDKCAYCETPVLDSPQIDWFRPTFGAEREDGTVDQHHYVWLVGEWGNLYLCCQECSGYKKNHFPASLTAKFGATINQLRRQREGRLLDPCWDRPENYFLLDSEGYLSPKKERAHLTIQLLQLNRIQLCVQRQEALGRFLKVWNAQVIRLDEPSTQNFAPIYDVLDHKSPFVGSIYMFLWQLANGNKKQTLKQVIESGPTDTSIRYLLRSFGPLSIEMIERGPGELVPYRPESDIIEDSNSFRPIRRVLIENFKGIRRLELEIPRYTNQNFAVVGENAAGKTTVLQAIALGLAGPREANRIVPDARNVLSVDAFEGRITIQFEGERDTNEIFFSRNSHQFQGETQRLTKVFGYGPYRLLAKRETGQRKRGKVVRLHSLFDDGARLNGYHGWLDSLNNDQKADLAEVLQLLLISRETQVSVDSKTLSIRTNGKDHPIDSLSSGMQSVVSMCTDLTEALYSSGNSVLKDGFVLIVDELDAHLHPAWRIGILSRLRRAFPNAQIIFSTHDPLTLRGMEGPQVHVLARGDDGVVHEAAARYSDGQSIDQILTSPLFGLFSTNTLEWERRYNVYVDLLLKSDRGTITTKEQVELQRLVKDLEAAEVLGDTPRERLMYAVIDRYLSIKQPEPPEWDNEVLDELAKTIQGRIDSELGDAIND
jgi:predicted ATPase